MSDSRHDHAKPVSPPAGLGPGSNGSSWPSSSRVVVMMIDDSSDRAPLLCVYPLAARGKPRSTKQVFTFASTLRIFGGWLGSLWSRRRFAEGVLRRLLSPPRCVVKPGLCVLTLLAARGLFISRPFCNHSCLAQFRVLWRF